MVNTNDVGSRATVLETVSCWTAVLQVLAIVQRGSTLLERSFKSVVLCCAGAIPPTRVLAATTVSRWTLYVSAGRSDEASQVREHYACLPQGRKTVFTSSEFGLNSRGMGAL